MATPNPTFRGAAAYTPVAPNLQSSSELGARVKTLGNQFPWLAADGEALIALASLPEDDAKIRDRANAMFTSVRSAQFVGAFNQYDDARRRGLWQQLTPQQQKLMRQDGADVPDLEPAEDDSAFETVFGWAADATGDVLGFGHEVINATVVPALKTAAMVGDTFQHLYRTMNELENRAAGRDLFSGEDPSLTENGLLLAIAHPTEFVDAWTDTGVGERVFTQKSQDEAREILQGSDVALNLAQELALASPEDVAIDLAGLDKGPYGDNFRRHYAVDHLAKRAGKPGSPEYESAYKQIDTALDDPYMRDAIKVLGEGHVSLGRSIERWLGVDEGPGRGWLSGSIDFGAAIWLDPTLIAGKFHKATQAMRYGVRVTSYGDNVLAKIDDLIEKTPGVRLLADEIAAGLNSGDLNRLARDHRGIETLIEPLSDFYQGTKVRVGADGVRRYKLKGEDILDFYRDAAGLKAIVSGGVWTSAHGVTQLPRITAAGVRRKMIAGELRDVIDHASAKPHSLGEFAAEELTTGKQVGAFLANTPVVRQLQLPASKLAKAVFTQAPQAKNVLLTGNVGGRISQRELRLAGEMIATLSEMSPRVKDVFLNTMLASDTPAARRAGIKAMYQEALRLGGFLDDADPAVKEFVERTLGIEGKRYSMLDNDIKAVGGLTGIHEGILLQGDRAEAWALPSFRELALATRKMNTVRTIWGMGNRPLWDAAMSKVWKPSVLLRIGFIPRAAGDELLSFLMRDHMEFLRGFVAATAVNDLKVPDLDELRKLEHPTFGQRPDFINDFSKHQSNPAVTRILAKNKDASPGQIWDSVMLGTSGQFTGFYVGKAGRTILRHIEMPDEAWKANRPFYKALHSLTFGADEGITDPWTAFLSARIRDAERWTRSGVAKAAVKTKLLTPDDLEMAGLIASDPKFQGAWAQVSTGQAGFVETGAAALRAQVLGPRGEIRTVGVRRTPKNQYVLHTLSNATDPVAYSMHHAMRVRWSDDVAGRARLQEISAYMSPENRRHIEAAFGERAEDALNRVARNVSPELTTDADFLRMVQDGDVAQFGNWEESMRNAMSARRATTQDPAEVQMAELLDDERALVFDRIMSIEDKNTRSFVLGRMVDASFDREVREGLTPLRLYTNKEEALAAADDAGLAKLRAPESFQDFSASDWSVNAGDRPVLSRKAARAIFDEDAELRNARPVAADEFDDAYARLAQHRGMATEDESLVELSGRQSSEVSAAFFSDDGNEALHRIITTALLDRKDRQISSIQDVHDVASWINTGIQGPEYAIATPHKLEDAIRWGFDTVIGKSIDSIVRQPMFMANALKGLKEGQVVRDVTLRDEFTKIVEQTPLPFVNHTEAFKFLDDLKTNNGVDFEERWLRSRTQLLEVKKAWQKKFGELPTAEEYKALRQTANMKRNLEFLDRDVAMERAIADSVPFIDDHHIRSQFQEWANNFVPFWFAEEQFLKRWARTARFSPEGFQNAQLFFMGMRHAGVIRKNEFGEDVFVYPGNGVMATMLAQPIKWLTGEDMTVPIANALTGEVRFSLPGLDNAGVPAFGPFVTVPTGFLTNAFPELRGLRTAVQGERAVEGKNPLLQLAPTSVARFMAAAQPEDYMSAQFAVMSYMAANDMQPPDDASPHEIQEYLDRVKQWTRSMLIVRAIYGFAAPASPQISIAQTSIESRKKGGSKFLRQEWLSMLNNYPSYEEAFGAFIKRYPDGVPYTTSPNETPSGAHLYSTNEALKSMDEHADFYSAFTAAGPWFLPQGKETDPFNRMAYHEQAANGMRIKKSPLEFYNAIQFSRASETYFATVEDAKDAMERAATAGERQEIEAWLAKWKASYFLQHPVFQLELENNRSRERRRSVLDEMRLAFNDPKAPASSHVKDLREMVMSLDDYKQELRSFGTSRRAPVQVAKRALRDQFESWGSRYARLHPEVAQFWKAIIAPEAGINAYDDVEADDEFGAA